MYSCHLSSFLITRLLYYAKSNQLSYFYIFLYFNGSLLARELLVNLLIYVYYRFICRRKTSSNCVVSKTLFYNNKIYVVRNHQGWLHTFCLSINKVSIIYVRTIRVQKFPRFLQLFCSIKISIISSTFLCKETTVLKCIIFRAYDECHRFKFELYNRI